VKAFLDANVLFSAALGGPSFELLWQIAAAGKVELLTSEHCRMEAASNLHIKAPDRERRLPVLLRDVTPVAEGAARATSAALLPPDDAPVLDAALAACADYLVTGDLRHFGPLMKRDDLGIRVRTVRAFLLGEQPSGREAAAQFTFVQTSPRTPV